MKVVKIDGENCHIFWMAWGISMKFSGIMSLMIILKVTKKTEIYLPSRRYIFRKTTVGVKLTNQIRFNDSFTEKPHTVCSKFLWPFSTFNFLIWDGDSSYLICPVLTPFLFCPCFFVCKLQTENCKSSLYLIK